MKHERAKSQSVKMLFLLIDIVLMILIPSIECYMLYKMWTAKNQEVANSDWFMIYLYPSILEAVFSLILTLSAVYIAKWVKKSTHKKQNTCLLYWHLINLVLLVVMLILSAIGTKK